MKFEISPKSTEVKLNWDESIIYCHFLDYNGVGWRLPTKDELNEIFLMKNDFEKYWYWSSTEKNDIYNYALIQNFNVGGQGYIYKDTHYYVRAIRDL